MLFWFSLNVSPVTRQGKKCSFSLPYNIHYWQCPGLSAFLFIFTVNTSPEFHFRRKAFTAENNFHSLFFLSLSSDSTLYSGAIKHSILIDETIPLILKITLDFPYNFICFSICFGAVWMFAFWQPLNVDQGDWAVHSDALVFRPQLVCQTCMNNSQISSKVHYRVLVNNDWLSAVIMLSFQLIQVL